MDVIIDIAVQIDASSEPTLAGRLGEVKGRLRAKQEERGRIQREMLKKEEAKPAPKTEPKTGRWAKFAGFVGFWV